MLWLRTAAFNDLEAPVRFSFLAVDTFGSDLRFGQFSAVR